MPTFDGAALNTKSPLAKPTLSWSGVFQILSFKSFCFRASPLCVATARLNAMSAGAPQMVSASLPKAKFGKDKVVKVAKLKDELFSKKFRLFIFYPFC